MSGKELRGTEPYYQKSKLNCWGLSPPQELSVILKNMSHTQLNLFMVIRIYVYLAVFHFALAQRYLE